MTAALLFLASILAAQLRRWHRRCFGTLAGGRLLARMPEKYFRPMVSLLILALGIVMLSGFIR